MDEWDYSDGVSDDMLCSDEEFAELQRFVFADDDTTSFSSMNTYDSTDVSIDELEDPFGSEQMFTLPPLVKPRRTYPKRNYLESSWWKMFLTEEQKHILKHDTSHRDTKLFKVLFRVSFSIFEKLREIAATWYDEDKRDSCGRLVSNLDLLLLGVLHVLGHGVSNSVLTPNTFIDAEVHRLFFKKHNKHLESIKDQYIYMPTNWIELENVTNDYAELGIAGCVGSVDAVHIGWDRCPRQLYHLYKGRYAFPSIAYNVICNNRRWIQSVSQGHPGARNDKHICRLHSDVVQLTFDDDNFLKTMKFTVKDENGNETELTGYHLICDGGYLRWPTLINPVKDLEYGDFARCIEGARKDIEDVFGMLKSRFLFVKNWNKLQHHTDIDAAFVTCCILHNMLMDENGFTDPNLPPPANSNMMKYRNTTKGDSLWERNWAFHQVETAKTSTEIESDKDLSQKWANRMLALKNHFIHHMEQKSSN